ncbi:MAG: hypothetical protein AUI11_05365 [Acidobacteria bacterium 13_2_20CM_2_66_4]|nr:MAG: hypothetical protein AUI11_05365 [Acidobacteria bacterium 13_2_20CM_2_66_4]
MIARLKASRDRSVGRAFQATGFGVLFRTFFAQLFTSETVTSDVQLRQAMMWVLAFVLTPCLLILIQVFPLFQLLVIRIGRIHPPPGVIVRATAVRNLMAEDMLEWAIQVLVGYSMVTVGLVAVFVWDALSFDRRDAMVLGPMPLRGSTIITSKLAALTAFLLGSSAAVNLLNAVVFGLETSDQFGAGTAVLHFVGCFVVTCAGATLVFAAIVMIRGTIAVIGGPRLAAAAGSLLQFVFVVALLAFVIGLFASPTRRGRLVIPTLTSWSPTTWFVAWFEVLRGSDRGSWPEFVALARRGMGAVAMVVGGAVLASIAAFQRQMQLALTPSASPGPLGRARVSRAVATLFVPRDHVARATSDFILTTIARSRAQQAPIAIGAAVGLALVVLGFVRERGEIAAMLLVVPLLLAYCTAIGLRASFFVPSELAASWTFHANAPDRSSSYRRGIRASIFGFLAPGAALVALAIGGAGHAVRVALVVVALANLLVLTIDFVPFTRAYEPGHAKLKTRWPLYAFGSYAFSYGALKIPILYVVLGVLALELIGRRTPSRWSAAPREEDFDSLSAVTVLDLTSGARAALTR